MKDWLHASGVAIQHIIAEYSDQAPFHPAIAYPEYPFKMLCASCANPAYAGVREALRLLCLDEDNFGSERWNPLGAIIFSGDTVLLKPNLIRESHGLHLDTWEQIITHGSLLRAVLDYVFIALKGNGKVVIADGPQTDSDFDVICQRAGLHEIVEFYKSHGFEIHLLDLRRDRWYQKGDVIYKRVPLPGDPAGYTTVELGGSSEFSSYHLSGDFYGADYDMAETASYHQNDRHAYVLCRSVMDADVVINLPKMKTHKKTGITLSLKNMVGINGYRNCLPHHTMGTPDEDGDEFPATNIGHKVQSRATRAFKKMLVARGGRAGSWARLLKRVGRSVFGDTNQVVRSGNWYGNDTAWRMVLDLNKALFYFEGEGKPRTKPLRYLTLVDGIIAGEGDGPVVADPLPAGLIVAGLNPVAVDTVCATLMGFDFCKIPMLAHAWKVCDCPLAEFSPQYIRCRSNVLEWNGTLSDLERASHLGFKPHFGWKGHMEHESGASVRRAGN